MKYMAKYKIGDILTTRDNFKVEVREIFFDNYTKKWYYSVVPVNFSTSFNREIEEKDLKKVID